MNEIKAVLSSPIRPQARSIAISSAAASARVQAGSIVADSFIGDGVQTVFTLSKYPQSDAYVFVTINGIMQQDVTFSVVGNVLTFTEAPFDGDEIEIRTINFAGSIVFSSTLSTTSANQVIDEFPKTDFRSAKYFVQMRHGSEYYASDVTVLHNDIDVFITEFGIIFTDVSLGDISAQIVGNNIQLTVTPAYTNTVVSGQRITLTT